jgi:HEAT repeat protein
LTGNIINQIGQRQITDDEALRFLRTSLTGADPRVRSAAVEAVGRMKTEIKSKFVTELRRIEGNPEEADKTRALARAVLAEQ